MANDLHHQKKILSMNISCCEICPARLKKKLEKMSGVNKVAIDTENNLVYVFGNIDAVVLLDKVAKLGKEVVLLPANQHPRKRNEGRSHEEKKYEQKEEHKCEAYVPPSFDPRTCRDFYCKVHPRGRNIVNKLPADYFGMAQMPFYGSGYAHGPYGGGPYQYPRWYGDEPPQFGYAPPPRYLPQPPFGFQ